MLCEALQEQQIHNLPCYYSTYRLYIFSAFDTLIKNISNPQDGVCCDRQARAKRVGLLDQSPCGESFAAVFQARSVLLA